MLLGRQRIAGNAQPATATLAWQAITQHDRQRQRQTVRTQLHRLPAGCSAVQMPAEAITAQPRDGLRRSQQDMSRQHPGRMCQTRRE